MLNFNFYNPTWRKFSLYPALLLFYGGSLASIISKRYKTLATLLEEPKVIDINFNNSERLLVSLLSPSQVMDLQIGQQLPGMERQKTPVSCYLYSFLKPFFDDYLPNEKKYDRYFDCLELLVGLIQADFNYNNMRQFYGDSGRLIWKWNMNQVELGKTKEFQEIITSLIDYGFFNNSEQRYSEIYQEHKNIIQQRNKLI